MKERGLTIAFFIISNKGVRRLQEYFKVLDDLSSFRNKKQMDEYYNYIKEEVSKNRQITELIRLKKGRFKEFIEEYIPAYIFSKSVYFPENAQIKIIIGNQGYDALMKLEDGLIEKLEFTSYIDGPREVEIAKSLNEKGIWRTRLSSLDTLEERRKHFLEETKKNIDKKATKNYSDVSLVFSIHIMELEQIPEHHDYRLQDKVREYIQATTFNAKEVFLIIDDGGRTELIDDRVIRIK